MGFSPQEAAAGTIFIISLPSSLLVPDLQSETWKLSWYSTTKPLPFQEHFVTCYEDVCCEEITSA